MKLTFINNYQIRQREREAAAYDWHEWFAWRPVYLSFGNWRWLETVQRKRNGWEYWQYQYRNKSDGV